MGKKDVIPVYLSTTEVMELLSITRYTALTWAAEGILKAWNPTGVINAKKLYKISDNPIIKEAMESQCKKVRRGS